jgi:rRNA maturation RNase YbeY
MAIRFNNHEKIFKLKNKRKIVNWIKRIVSSYGKSAGEISIIFTSDNYILEINNQYLNHNYFTDIITFDYSTKSVIEGDIFISVDTVLSNSKKFHTSFKEEILRVIIHGVLHLIGFKDKTAKEKSEMRRNEDLALIIFEANE